MRRSQPRATLPIVKSLRRYIQNIYMLTSLKSLYRIKMLLQYLLVLASSLLFCAYDAPLPPPLAGVRHTTVPFATAMVLRPVEAGGGPVRSVLELRYVAEPPPPAPPAVDALDALAAENPVARALPLLRALAARRPARLHLPLLGDAHLDLVLEPC